MIPNIQGVSSRGTVASLPTEQAQHDPSTNVHGPGQKSLSKEQVRAVVQEMNKAMESLTSGLEFSVDGTTNQTVVKVINTNTNQVIRQIPSEEMLRVSQRIAELLGVLYDHQG